MEIYAVLIIIPLILLAFLAFGVYTFLHERKIRSKGIRILAKVIKIDTIRSQQDVSYKLTVEFTDNTGKTITQPIEDTLSNQPKQEIPFNIPIIYLKGEKEIDIVLEKNKTMLIIGFSVSLFSILMLVLFVFYAIENLL